MRQILNNFPCFQVSGQSTVSSGAGYCQYNVTPRLLKCGIVEADRDISKAPKCNGYLRTEAGISQNQLPAILKSRE